MRQALELSITVMPASANLGASSSDVLPPAKKNGHIRFCCNGVGGADDLILLPLNLLPTNALL